MYILYSAPSSDFFGNLVHMYNVMYICRKVVGTSPPVKQCEIRLLVQVHMVAADIGKAIYYHEVKEEFTT